MKVLIQPSSLSLTKVLFAAAVLSVGLCQASLIETPGRATLERAGRLLQSNSNYDIQPSPDIKTNCDDSGVSSGELAIDLAKRDEEQAKIEGRFPAVVDAFNSGGSSNYGGLVQKMAAGSLGVSIVFAVLSLLSLKFIFCWSMCECFCKKTCCVKAQAENEKRGKGRLICWILGAAFGVVVIIITIVWVTQLAKVASRVKDIKCGVSILHSDLVYGTKLEGGAKFIGINSLDSLLGEYITLMGSITSIKADATTVKSQNLDTKAATMETNYNSFKSSYNPNSYKFKGTATPATMVLPNIATAIKVAADGPLGEEVKLLKDTAIEINKAVKEIESFDDSSINSSKKTLTDIRSAMGKDLKKPIDDMHLSIVSGGSNYVGTVESASKAMMAVSIVVIVAFTILYLIILFCTAKLNKCHKLKCVSKIIMLIQLLVGLLILVFAIIGTILSVAVTVICSVMNGAISNENYLTTIGMSTSDPTVNKLMNECIWKKGSGDLMKALSSETLTFDKITTITNGMQKFKDLSSNLTSQTSPAIGGGLMTNLNDYISFSAIDRGTPQSEDIQTGYDAFNTYGCTQDIMRPNAALAPATHTKSTIIHASTFGLNSPYCILLSTFPTTHKYGGRYTPTPAPPCASGSYLLAQVALTQTLESTEDYSAKLASCRSAYDTGFYSAEDTLFDAMNTALPQLSNIMNKIDGALNALKAIDGTFKSVADCTVFRKELMLLENIICYRVGNDFYKQNILAIALGALIFVYSWFMCCGIRLSNKQEGQNPNQVGPDSNYDKVGDQSSMANDKSGIVNNQRASPPGKTPAARKVGEVEYI